LCLCGAGARCYWDRSLGGLGRVRGAVQQENSPEIESFLDWFLSLRRTGLSSPAYRDWLDYVIVEDGRDVGRLYEDRHSRPELRWFWSITVYVNPKLGITTSGRVASLDEAKAQFLRNWQKVPQ
jgi:hypothetical protein